MALIEVKNLKKEFKKTSKKRGCYWLYKIII